MLLSILVLVVSRPRIITIVGIILERQSDGCARNLTILEPASSSEAFGKLGFDWW
jgi:hypothetical protein